MGETRSQMDNASVSTEDSIKLPPRPDMSLMKLGQGALPATEFDPLKHGEWENFWHQVEQNFMPINTEDVENFRQLPVNPWYGLRDPDLCVTHPMDLELTKRADTREKKREGKREAKREKSLEDGHSSKRPAERIMPPNVKMESSLMPHKSSSSNSELPKAISEVDVDVSTMRASLNSYPYTHRLVAALLDENVSGTSAPAVQPGRNNRSPFMDDVLWAGVGNEMDVRVYQAALEDRVKHELNENGLLEESKNDEVQTALREDQWRLRPLKTANRVRKMTMHYNIIGKELREQALRRERKRHDDKVEMAYLERMVSKMKKNKKSRSKFQKLFQRMFGHYKDKDKNNDKAKKGTDAMTNSRAITSGDVRSSGKKKKKKISHDLPAKSAAPHAGTSRSTAT